MTDVAYTIGSPPDPRAWEARSGDGAGFSQTLQDPCIDDVIAMQPAFDQLRDAHSQLSALLLLAAVGSRHVACHPMLPVARHACAEAGDVIRSARGGSRSGSHARHLREAWASIAFVAERIGDASPVAIHAEIDDLTRRLKCAYRHLHTASLSVAGFDLVDAGQACCAEHAGSGAIGLAGSMQGVRG